MAAPALNGQVGEVGFTLTVTHKDGTTDSYDMVGTIVSAVNAEEPSQQPQKENTPWQ